MAATFKPSGKQIAIAGILVAEIALLASVAWFARTSPADGIAVRTDQAALRIADQKAVNSTVTVEWVVVPGPSWVIVQTDYQEGAPGTVIGKTHVDAGESINVEVGLKTATLPRTAFVTLVSDRGEVGKYEYSGEMASGGMGGAASASASADKPYVANGALVSMPFSLEPLTFDVAADVASIGAATRDSEGATVTATQVVAPGKSWLAVSEATTAGATGEVLGVVPVEAGTTQSVVVGLREPVGKKAPLVASLHADLGKAGQFEYVISDVGNSPDQPYVAGGQTVRVQVPPAR